MERGRGGGYGGCEVGRARGHLRVYLTMQLSAREMGRSAHTAAAWFVSTHLTSFFFLTL